MSVTFCEFFEKLLHFYLLPGLKQVFSVTIFRLLPSPINFLFIDLQNISNLLSILPMNISY